MSQKKALLDQLAFFQALNMSKSDLRKQLRKHGYVEITMHDGVKLQAKTFSQALRCIRWNFRMTTGESYRQWRKR